MASATVDGLTLAYEVIGDGRPWVITPGGRFTKDEPGVRELANALAAEGNRVLIWDRPNCGESERLLHRRLRVGDAGRRPRRAVDLARHGARGDHRGIRRRARLDAGCGAASRGRRGSRVVVDQRRHVRDSCRLGVHYCGNSTACGVDGRHGGRRRAAGMGRGPRAQPIEPATVPRPGPRRTFVATFERWMLAYCPCGDELVPGLADDTPVGSTFPRSCSAAARATPITRARRRSGSRSCSRTRGSSSLPGVTASGSSVGCTRRRWRLFGRWPLLAPPLLSWASDVFK